MVKDILVGAVGSYPFNLTEFGSEVYFYADDGTNGNELWKSNGTASGTVMVKDINSTDESYPDYLTVFAGALYFAADDGVSGYELWKSDGTSSGTVRVGDINPNSGSSLTHFAASATTLFFSANNGTLGTELWAVRPIAPVDNPPRPTSPPTTPTSAPTASPTSGIAKTAGRLATTGTSVPDYIGLALGLLIVGAVLLLLGAGRRRESDRSDS
jgi:ELWxxDGT repeat protein